MDSNSNDLWTTEAILNTSFNIVSAVVCLLAAILLLVIGRICSKRQNTSTTIIHTACAYRLALYQVLTALAVAVTDLFQIYYLFNIQRSYNYGRVCTPFGWLLLYLKWVNLFIVMQLSFSLLIFVHFRNNLMEYEKVHVLLSLLLPSLVVLPPLISYLSGDNDVGCFQGIENGTQNLALIEEFTLWDTSSIIVFLIMVVFIAIVYGINFKSLKLRSLYKEIRDSEHWNALREFLPLATFPIVFIIFQIIIFSFHFFVLLLNPAVMNFSTSLFSLRSVVTQIAYFCVVTCFEKCF